MEALEIPKLDRRLHLLILMHQWIDEAQALRGSEPRLEFREEPTRLTIRATGTDVEQSIFYEGAESGEVLKGLEADGYVELDHSDTGPSASAGFVTITEKGLKKIRFRRAFESNRPRFVKRWEISLLGRPRGIGVSKLWRAGWEGHNISVSNWQGLRRRRPEGYSDGYLNVDNRFPPKYRVEKSRFSKDLYGELPAADGLHEVHAHIGLLAPLLKIGCLIAVDGVVIGGDLGERRRFLT